MSRVVAPSITDAIVDKDGRPTQAYHTFLASVANALNSNQVTLDDFETRIEALEP